MQTYFRTFFLMITLSYLSLAVEAQTINWQSSNGNTTTTDKVGIGTTLPSSTFELNAPTAVQTIRYTAANYGSLYFFENNSFVGFLQMIGSTWAPYPGAQNALMLGNLAAGPEIFYTSGAERLRIDASGNVGIGTASPAALLDVFKDWNTPATTNILAAFDSYDDPSRLVLRRANGNLGAETQVLSGNTIGGIHFRGWHSSGAFSTNSSASIVAVAAEDFTSAGIGASLLLNTTPIGSVNPVARIQIAPNGSVGIGALPSANLLEVGGDAHFNGTVSGNNIKAQYQDLAEWVPMGEKVEAGMVVVVATNATNTVVASDHSYDTRVAGVVSAHPGLILGQESVTKAQIATTGRVKVRVDATKRPIAIGDLLVTSNKPGMAMLSEPVELSGIKFHRPGTLIGKALEPLPNGEGEILVLLSLQ